MKTKQFLMMALLALTVCSCKEKETEYDASGIFETTDVIVSAKGAGEIMGLNIEEGQEVTAGTKLGYIDSKQLELKKTQAEASKTQVSATKTATESKKMDVAPQIAALQQQIANLKREKARFEALYRDNAATEKQVSDIDYQIKTAQKQIAAIEAQYATNNGAIDKQGATYDAQTSQIDAQISQIDDQIANYNIVSPISGTILSKYAEVGEYAAPGRALFKVANVQDMKLRAYITADQLTKIKIGQKVKVYADQGTSDRKEYEGTIEWISTKAEFTPKTIQTRDERANLVYAIKIAVKNDGLIKRGMYGDVKF